MIPYKKESPIKKTELGNVKIGGYAAELMENFFYERIFSKKAKNVVFRECEEAFLRATDGDGPQGLWQGEFWGKWVISAARACRYTKDAELKEFLHGAALRLIGLQRDDGYIGTYKVSTNFFLPDPTKHGWNWNIWCRKYTLWGLLECHELTEDKKILDACVRFADNLISEVEASGKTLGDTGTFKGLPSCSILKPMLILYRMTEEERYLDFCLDFVKAWENPDIMPGLIANSLSGKPFSQWYDFDEIRWAKAYEMMSCFDGLAELYRVTGEKKYLDACESFYDVLMKYEKNPIFSVAFNDEFRDAASNVNAITEPCDVIHLMRLCHELFTLTGNSKYMDSFELAFYNPFLASSIKDGSWGARGARGHGRHLYAHEQAGMLYNHCCVNNMPRGYMNMAESQVMSDENSLYINLYTPAEITVGVGGEDVKVSISGDYLAESKARINIDFGGKPCAVKLRIPSWSESSEVIVDGERLHAESGYFAATPKSDRCEIEVIFDNSVKITRIPASLESAEDEWKPIRWASEGPHGSFCPCEMFLKEDRCVLKKGAVLLCRSRVAGNTRKEMFEDIKPIDESFKCTLKAAAPRAGVNLRFEATFCKKDKKFTTVVCDYASGSNMLFDNPYSFSIYF